MNTIVLATALLLGQAAEPRIDTRPEPEPAISMVDELLLDVTDRTVTTDEPMDADAPAGAAPGPRHAHARSSAPSSADGLAPL